MKLLALLMTFNLWISPANASNNNPQLEQLIKTAVSNNPRLKVIKYRSEQLKALVSPSGSYDDPILSYEQMNLPIDTYSSSQTPMSGKKISLSQKIPFPGKLSKKENMAEFRHQSSLHQYKHQKYQMILAVKKSYFKLFFEIKNKEVLSKQKNLIKQLIVSARSKYTLGKIPQAEIINFQMEETELISKKIISERKIAVEKNRLANLIGSIDTDLKVNPDHLKKTYLNFSKLNLKSITERVLKNNHQLKAAKAQKESSNQGLSLAKLDYLPNFNIKYSYTAREANPADQGVDFASAMISVNIPLWFTKQSGNVEAASFNQLRADSQLQETKITLTNQVHHIFTELAESYKTLTLFENTLLPLAKQAVRTSKTSYLSGRVDYATLLRSISKRFNTELSFYKALAKYETQIAKLEALIAGPI